MFISAEIKARFRPRGEWTGDSPSETALWNQTKVPSSYWRSSSGKKENMYKETILMIIFEHLAAVTNVEPDAPKDGTGWLLIESLLHFTYCWG